MQRRLSTIALAATTALSLTGCLIPEKFTASFNVNPDASALYRYEGTAVNYFSAQKFFKAGKMSKEDEARLKKEMENNLPKGIKKASYLGDGRIKMESEETLRPGQSSDIIKIFQYSKANDGVYTIQSTEMSDKMKTELKEMGINFDGKVEVVLPRGAKVIFNNANSTPGFFSKSYVWKIGSTDGTPSIRFTMPK